MTLALEPQEFKLTAKQNEAIALISSPAKHTLLYGGSRSTKTFTFVRATIIRALAVPYSRHLIARFRFNSVKKSVMLDTFPKVMQLCWPKLDWHQDNVDFYARFPNGSELWFGGLDDKERTEKILGNEYATILLNECSQISYGSQIILMTRLAQKCPYLSNGEQRILRLKMFYDENPPAKGHWSHKLFIEKKDPITRLPLKKPDNYASLLMNPVDNLENLTQDYIDSLDDMPKRQRDRFFLGKFTDDTENALWTNEIIDGSRVDKADLPQMKRVVVGVDPSGAGDEDDLKKDDIGIVAVGLGDDGIAYVLEDATIKSGPRKWGQNVSDCAYRTSADRAIVESNFGGDMAKYVIETADPNLGITMVRASRGKHVRAEPISALHEKGKIKMVGQFNDLEDELCGMTTNGYMGQGSPNRLDAFVWAVTDLFYGLVNKPEEDNKVYKIPKLKRL